MRALVIREPWVGLILAGEKTWELRSRSTNVRGVIGLIRKGSGTVVGVAELTDSLPPLEDAAAFARAEALHGVTRTMRAEVMRQGWITPWVLEGAKALRSPVRYVHPAGAVTWVKLDEPTSHKVMQART